MCNDNVLGSVVASSQASCVNCSIQPCRVGANHRTPEGLRPRHDVWIVTHDVDTPVTSSGYDTLCARSRKVTTLVFREHRCEASLRKSE
jgi:hypothetical protein